MGGRFRLFVSFLRRMGYTGDYEVAMGGTSARILANLGSEIEAAVLLAGWYERRESEVIGRLLKSDMTAVDAGANVGVHSMRMAACVGPTGSVFCFEPNPETYARLVSNAQLNGFGNVIPLKYGLGSRSGRKTLFPNPPGEMNRNANMLVPNDYGVEVDVLTLDEAWSRWMARRPIGFIKMDVEGFELPIIQGGMEAIAQHRPFIMSEFSPEYSAALGYGWGDILALCVRLNYAVRPISRRRSDNSVYNFVMGPAGSEAWERLV